MTNSISYGYFKWISKRKYAKTLRKFSAKKRLLN